MTAEVTTYACCGTPVGEVILMGEHKCPSGLWTREEAYEFLDTRFHMDKQPAENNEKLINDLMAMRHRPHCRTHMASIAPEYGEDCTCDGKYLRGSE